MTTLIKNGTIIDGSGALGFKGSIFFDRQKITSVIKDGETLPAADVVIDADGLAVAPGFIDMHSHADWVLPSEQHPAILKCLVEQGVTSIVGGNCGISPAPKVKMSNENAIMRMTSTSADRFGLKDIGRLQPGKAGDIVIFDPDKIADSPPTNGGPYGKPQGIYHVFINGAHVVKDGSYIDGAREGRVL